MIIRLILPIAIVIGIMVGLFMAVYDFSMGNTRWIFDIVVTVVIFPLILMIEDEY